MTMQANDLIAIKKDLAEVRALLQQILETLRLQQSPYVTPLWPYPPYPENPYPYAPTWTMSETKTDVFDES